MLLELLHVPPRQLHHEPGPFSAPAVCFISDSHRYFHSISPLQFLRVYTYIKYCQYFILFIFVSPQVSDSASPSLRSTNLSALKKRWEQAGNLAQTKPSPGPVSSISSSSSSSSSRSRPAAVTHRVDLTAITEDQKPPAAAPRGGEEFREMDGREMSQSDRGSKQEEQVPTSPCASYEKPRVPLNNLKMKFERGEEAMSKVVVTVVT